MRLVLLVAALVAGCASLRSAGPSASAPKEVIWRGEVIVDADLVLGRGSRLVLEPGTIVRFVFRDDDGDGWGDASLVVQGDLVARGTAEHPVVFTSATAPAEPGQWGEIRIDYGSFDLSYSVIEGSTRGLHAHFCKGTVSDSIFRRNVDGTRLGESSLTIERCLFTGHEGKGYNARRCKARVRDSLFRRNRNAIFLFEGDDDSVFEGNVFRGNQTPLRLGDFFEGVANAPGNDWGGSAPEPGDQGGPGRIEATSAALDGRGPRDWALWSEDWKVTLDGYVDAGPVVADEGIYASSWGGEVVRLGALDGSTLARVRLPDAVDASPALGTNLLAVNCWDRAIHLLRRGTLEPLDSFAESASPADDHRQSGPVFGGTVLYAATWAGRVRAFDTTGDRLTPLWTLTAGGPFRADLSLVGPTLLAASQDGRLYAIDASSGRLLWSFEAGAPLLAAPTSDGHLVYLAGKDGMMHAVSLASGVETWRTPLGEPVWYAPPALVGGRLFQGTDAGSVKAVDAATGTLLWSRPVGAGVRSRPAIIGDSLLAVGTEGGLLWLLDAATGLERDCLPLGGASFSTPAVAGTRTFVGSRAGMVTAVDARIRETGGEEAP